MTRMHVLDPAEVRELLLHSGLTGLTIWPEWTWAIDLPTPLAKRVENRGWAPPRRFVGTGGRGALLAIHAGAHVGGRPGIPARREGLLSVCHMARRAGCIPRLVGDERDPGIELHDMLGNVKVDTTARPIVTRGIVGVARLTRVMVPGVEETNRDLRETGGVFGWKVPDAHGWVFKYLSLAEPVPCSGAQGLWEVPAHLVGAVAERVAA